MTPLSGGSPRVSIVVVCGRNPDGLARCLERVRTATGSAVSTETVVVFTATPAAERERLQPLLGDTQVIVSEVDLGVAGAVNRAADATRSEYLVTLDVDAEVQSDWLVALVQTVERHADVDAVSSRILHPDGTLREAGRVLWRDGSTIAVASTGSNAPRRYDYVRDVDCASIACLLIRRRAFAERGGFDERYFPGPGADVDLCLAIRRRRRRIVYQPRSVVVLASRAAGDGGGTAFAARRGRALLRDKWAAELARFPVAAADDGRAIELAVHRARHSPRRLLMIDDRLPDPAAGAGYPRMMEIVRELAGGGYAISFYPNDLRASDRGELRELGVDVIDGDLIARLASPASLYDAAIVSRPHNVRWVARLRRYQPQCAVIYDAEALSHRRLERQAHLLVLTDPGAAEVVRARAHQARRAELSLVRAVDRVVALSEVEGDVLSSVPGHCPVDVIEPRAVGRHRMTPSPFAQRRGMLLVAGWTAPYPSPNSDGLEWFVDNVLPLIRQRLPWACLSVTGARPYAALRRLASPCVRFLGHVEDLARVYDQARVAVEPVRYGAGVKNKAVEALQHGVPLVASTVGAEGLRDTEGPAVTISDDPRVCAARITELIDDRAAWESARADLARLHERWEATPPKSWTATVDAAVIEKTMGACARHG